MISKNHPVVYPMEETWDTLIILDACRYDSFSKIQKEYFNGELSRRRSPATWTHEWALRAFPQHYEDVIYVSSNPIIASGELPISSLPWVQTVFQGDRHFFRTIDVWYHEWDRALGTVRPERVNEIALQVINAYPEKRLIIHYFQPHTPYICLGGVQFRKRHNLRYRISEILPWTIPKLLGKETGNRVLQGMGISRPSLQRLIVNRLGPMALQRAYESDLRLALECVVDLLDYLQGKIVVTSDHGEFLGEGGHFGHSSHNFAMPDHTPLTDIPWLELTREEILKKPDVVKEHEALSAPGKASEELIREKLIDLGYL